MINKEIKDFLVKTALENAISFGGKTQPKALVGKSMSTYPEVKSSMKELMEVITEIVEEINSMDIESQKAQLLEIDPLAFETKKEEKKEPKRDEGLPDLPVGKERVRVRFEPAPSGYLHIGHLYSIVPNYEFAKKHHGDFILRFGDTNPENIKKENYDQVEEDVKWITENGVTEKYYQSDRNEIYYKYLRMLVEGGHAFICKCDPDTFKEYIDKSKKCPHWDKDKAYNMKEYEGMFKDTPQGEAVIRFKGDINDRDPANRSFSLARINESEHARKGHKYRVWPTMHTAVAVDDVEMKITHVIRGKDHEINMIRQMAIHKALNWKSPIYFHTGRVKFMDIILSKTQLSAMIAEGKYEGWADPRVPSLLSYRTRGYQAKAFRDMLLAGGTTKRDSKITAEEYHKSLDFFNKAIIDPKAERYYFIAHPKKVHITDFGTLREKTIKLPKHPEHDLGFRTMKVENDLIIEEHDFNTLKDGDLVRLKSFATFKVTKKTKDTVDVVFHSLEFDKNLKIAGNIHFLNSEREEVEIIMHDNTRLKGFAEKMNIKEGAIIQFERFAFVKYDGNRLFHYTHK